MGGGKQLKNGQIAAITALCKEGKSNTEISNTIGISLRSVQRWTTKFHDCGDTDPPLQKKQPGRPQKTSKRTLNVLRRQVDSQPRITAPELKERNPVLLADVSVKTI